MPISSKNVKKQKTTALEVVKPPKTKPYNDIDLNNWKLYENVKTGTWWEFSAREKKNGHSYDYHGNYIPQIATQLLERYTKKGDIVLDLFFGSGTTGIEAKNIQVNTHEFEMAYRENQEGTWELTLGKEKFNAKIQELQKNFATNELLNVEFALV